MLKKITINLIYLYVRRYVVMRYSTILIGVGSAVLGVAAYSLGAGALESSMLCAVSFAAGKLLTAGAVKYTVASAFDKAKQSDAVRGFLNTGAGKTLDNLLTTSQKDALEEVLMKSLEDTIHQMDDGTINFAEDLNNPVATLINPYIPLLVGNIQAPLSAEQKASIAKHVLYKVLPSYVDLVKDNAISNAKNYAFNFLTSKLA